MPSVGAFTLASPKSGLSRDGGTRRQTRSRCTGERDLRLVCSVQVTHSNSCPDMATAGQLGLIFAVLLDECSRVTAGQAQWAHGGCMTCRHWLTVL